MADIADAFFDENVNPLDSAEEIIQSPNLSLNRANRDELFVEAAGKYCDYRMMFMWDEVMGALQFVCEYGVQIADANKSLACETVLGINSNLWLGHFDLNIQTMAPTFRYTQLFRGLQSTGADHIQDLINIAIDECDRNYPVFVALSHASKPDADDLALAMMPAAGRS